MTIEDREAEGFSRDEAEWMEWRRANPGAIADGETRRALTRAFADIPEEKLEQMREAIRTGSVPKTPTNAEAAAEIDRGGKRFRIRPIHAVVCDGLAGLGLIGSRRPRRLREGALSAERTPIAPPEPVRAVSIEERPTPSDAGGHGPTRGDDAAEAPVSLEEEALGREFSAETIDPSRITSCYGDAPPPAPRVPAFTRFLSAEGFARWTKRMPLGDDPALNAHCIEARRRWLPYGVALGRALDQLPWRFPVFAPRARPYDWAVDR